MTKTSYASTSPTSGSTPCLTKDDEVRLAKAIEAGKEAIEVLDAGGKDVTPSRKRELRRTGAPG